MEGKEQTPVSSFLATSNPLKNQRPSGGSNLSKLSSIGENQQNKEKSDIKSEAEKNFLKEGSNNSTHIPQSIENIMTKKAMHYLCFVTDIEKQSQKGPICQKDTLEFVKQQIPLFRGS